MRRPLTRPCNRRTEQTRSCGGRPPWPRQTHLLVYQAQLALIRRLRLIHWKSGVSSKAIMTYALFFSRFRPPISAISIGPRLNSPASAFRVSSLR